MPSASSSTATVPFVSCSCEISFPVSSFTGPTAADGCPAETVGGGVDDEVVEIGTAPGSASSTTLSVNSRHGWKSGNATAVTTTAAAAAAITAARQRLFSISFASPARAVSVSRTAYSGGFAVIRGLRALEPVWTADLTRGGAPALRPVDDCRRAAIRFQCSNRCSITSGPASSGGGPRVIRTAGRLRCGVAAASETSGPGGAGAKVDLDPHLALTRRAADQGLAVDQGQRFVHRRRWSMWEFDEAVEVRSGVVDGVEAPEQFLWRGRLWRVCSVQAHWTETAAWWERGIIGTGLNATTTYGRTARAAGHAAGGSTTALAPAGSNSAPAPAGSSA